MTPQNDDFAEYPTEVRSSTQRPSIVYTRLPEHYAIRRESNELTPSEDLVATLGEGSDAIDLFRGSISKLKGPAKRKKVIPVYSLNPGGAQAVPTGEVLTRFKEGVAVEDRRREIEKAGYQIAQILEYAPHAAWLRARSGEIAEALTAIGALEKIPDVENVEPQMLMARVSR